MDSVQLLLAQHWQTEERGTGAVQEDWDTEVYGKMGCRN